MMSGFTPDLKRKGVIPYMARKKKGGRKHGRK
jgi:hypothetical protein